jgi:hypothetical protein
MRYEGLSYAPEFWAKYYERRAQGWQEVSISVESAVNEILYEWVDTNIGSDWIGTGQFWLFEQDTDATLFRLMWAC